ncbi:MAG: hypothetical protein AAGA23_03165 [Pseudomonadota bacterium]
MLRPITAWVFLCWLAAAPLASAENEGSQLYRAITVRAAPGAFAELLDWVAPRNGRQFYVMRHSQGDQWDLMILLPLETMSLKSPLAEIDRLIAFQEDNFAYGPPADTVASQYRRSGLFHVEVFSALAGKKEALLDQRRRENAYLEATGQQTNLIFRSAAGSDIDVFTIGFHRSLKTFAAASPPSEEAAEEAARAAGFKNRADLSFSLRALISSHRDTLATRIQ